MTNFQKEQRDAVLKASDLLRHNQSSLGSQGEWYVALLLRIIGEHPTLMDSTVEADENLQNCVNELVDTIVVQDFINVVKDLSGNVSANSTTMRGN